MCLEFDSSLTLWNQYIMRLEFDVYEINSCSFEVCSLEYTWRNTIESHIGVAKQVSMLVFQLILNWNLSCDQ